MSIYSDTIGGWLGLGQRSGEWSKGLSSFSGWLKCSEIRPMVVYAYKCTWIHGLTYLIWLRLIAFKICLNKTFWKWVSARVECYEEEKQWHLEGALHTGSIVGQVHGHRASSDSHLPRTMPRTVAQRSPMTGEFPSSPSRPEKTIPCPAVHAIILT